MDRLMIELKTIDRYDQLPQIADRPTLTERTNPRIGGLDRLPDGVHRREGGGNLLFVYL